MLKIKLARFGKKHQPHYRIVVNEARDKRDGKYVALLGHYTPVAPKQLVIDAALYEKWLSQGAKPTETVAALFKRFQSGNPFPTKAAKPSKKALAKAAAAQEATAAPATPEAPATAEVTEETEAAASVPAETPVATTT